MRERLRLEKSGPEIEFSVGYSYLSAGGNPDEALRAADADMYRVKSGVSTMK